MSGARVLAIRTAVSPQQRRLLDHVLSWQERLALGQKDALPCIRDLVRLEWRGRGHAATYDRAWRLIRRGFLRATRVGNRVEVELTSEGYRKLGKLVDPHIGHRGGECARCDVADQIIASTITASDT